MKKVVPTLNKSLKKLRSSGMNIPNMGLWREVGWDVYFNVFGTFIKISLIVLRTWLIPDVLLFIKQFVVTNCSKERPSSIVNETLKNGNLMLKYTSKESGFHVDFKYISFIKFSLCHQSYEPGKSCFILENRGKHPLKVTES